MAVCRDFKVLQIHQNSTLGFKMGQVIYCGVLKLQDSYALFPNKLSLML